MLIKRGEGNAEIHAVMDTASEGRSFCVYRKIIIEGGKNMPNQNRRLCWGKLFIIIALFGLLSTQAVAASFDCNKAASWLEKTVCSNPELSKLDEQLAKAYRDALASLSPEGQKETKQYQRQWLKELSSYGIAKRKVGFSEGDKAGNLSLLKSFYKKRIEQLQQSLIKFPGRIFRNVHVDHSKTDRTCPYVFVKKELTYPQIENPGDENEKFWNNFIAKKAVDKFKEYDLCQDMDHEYEVSFSNRHLISFQGQLYWYTQGLPHGLGGRFFFNWLLEPKRELKASDLFNDKTDWRNKLTELVAQKVKEQEAADEATYEIGPDGLEAMVTSPDEWEISKEGLGFRFIEQDWRGPTALITIGWKTLDPYVSKYGHALISD
jgi:uncharacterized protein